MASVDQKTSNDKIEIEINDSKESKASSPVPPKRKIKAKDDGGNTLEEDSFKTEEHSLIVSDNSRVVFVNEEITKSEVFISNISDAKEMITSVQTVIETSDQSSTNTTPDCQVIAGNTKSKIASFLEKANVNPGSAQLKIVMCKVNVNPQTSSSENNNVTVSDDTVQVSSVSQKETDQNLEHISDNDNSVEVEPCKFQMDDTKNLTIVSSTQNSSSTVQESSQQNSVTVSTTKHITKPTLILEMPVIIPMGYSSIESTGTSQQRTVITTSSSSKTETNEHHSITQTNKSSDEESTVIVKQSNELAETDLVSSTESEKMDVIISQSLKTPIVTDIEKVSDDIIKVVEKTAGGLSNVQNSLENSQENKKELSKLNSSITENAENSTEKPQEIKENLPKLKTVKPVVIIKIENELTPKEKQIKETKSIIEIPAPNSPDSSKPTSEKPTGQITPTTTKPTLMKKPTIISSEQPKLEKVPSVTKIPVSLHIEKAPNLKDKEKPEVYKVKKSKASLDLKSSTFDEPKLTNKQRTSSEQCLSLSKSDSEQATSKKLRATVDHLQHENATYKKLLESERSAFREYRAAHEVEARKEKAEARRREATLEGQLRAALKGQPMLMKSASTGDSSFPDAARLATALENAKTANKVLQEKLLMVTETDKRKAGELRAQHDAHTLVISQMERDSRAQLVKLLEELKSKERQLEQLKKGGVVRGTSPGGGSITKGPAKMAVADQLHFMEGQISRLEHEIQRRDDIIQTLRTSKVRRDRRASGQQLMKENLFKDILSDVDSAVSSAPNSLSPQPSPDLWYHPQDASHVEVDEGMLEAAKKQIQELEKALSVSTATQRSAQLRATQLDEQLQDLREHADLLEFRCLELEDASEKRNSLEELTDSDSGCTSPENRLKNSISPQLRRSDSGYKSPTRPGSPHTKSHRILTTPTTSFTECEPITFMDTHKGVINPILLEDSILDSDNQTEDIRYRLERMMLRTQSESDRVCLEQVLQLLWNLQALSGTLPDDDYTMVKHKKLADSDFNKNEFDLTKSGRIIATISPYSQKSHKSTDLIKSIPSNTDSEPSLNVLLKDDSKKLLYGLQESGIFEESDWDNKETQTEWCDCICAEPESDLATEVQRLNQIREQLEKSGAIRSKNLRHKHRANDFIDCSPVDLKQQKKREKKKLEVYESRIAVLENKVAVYESSGDVRDKKLAQRLQREVDLQSKIKNLEFDLSKLRKKHLLLEEERCEFEEAENDTRLHCQELEAEFDILTAKLRDMDDQRSSAVSKADCYRELAEEFEYKNMEQESNEKKMREKLKMMEKSIPALVCYNIYKIMEGCSGIDLKEAANSRCQTCRSGNRFRTSHSQLPMIGYQTSSTIPKSDPFTLIEKQLNSLVGDNEEVQIVCKKKDSTRLRRDAEEVGEAGKGDKRMNLRGGASKVSHQSSISQDGHFCDCQDYAKNRIEELLTNEMKMKHRIEELEKRELAFLETLTKGDEMWADMESSYKQRIKENDENEMHLAQDRNKWKAKCEQIEGKIQEMEENESTQQFEKKKILEEVRDLSKHKELLSAQVESSQMELLQTKTQMEEREEGLKKELASQRRLTVGIQEELSEHKKMQKEIEATCQCEVNLLKKDLCKATKDLREKGITIAELVEEVRILEKKLEEISGEMVIQRDEFAEKNRSLVEQIRCKTKELENLRGGFGRAHGLPTAEEELNQINKPKTCKCCTRGEDKSKKLNRPARNCKCQPTEEEIDLLNRLNRPSKSCKCHNIAIVDIQEEPKAERYPICQDLIRLNAEPDLDSPQLHKADEKPITKLTTDTKKANETFEKLTQTSDHSTDLTKTSRRRSKERKPKIVENPERKAERKAEHLFKPEPEARVPEPPPESEQKRAKPVVEPEQKAEHKPVQKIEPIVEEKKEVHKPKPNVIHEKVPKDTENTPKEKPELPKRKPKVSPRPKSEEDRKRVSRPVVSKNKNTGTGNPPLHMVDRGDNCIRAHLESNMCTVLDESMDGCLDEYSMNLYNQLMGDVRNLFEILRELLKKSFVETSVETKIEKLSQENKLLQDNMRLLFQENYKKAFNDGVESSRNIKENDELANQNQRVATSPGDTNTTEVFKKVESHLQNHLQNRLLREGHKQISSDKCSKSSSSNPLTKSSTCLLPVLPIKKSSPSPVNLNLKRYHSLSESRNEGILDLPDVMSKSDSAVTHNSSSAKELIASFNSMKSNQINAELPSHIFHAQPKGVGSLVFDRVTKLSNSFGNPKIQMGLKRSVSMVADSKTAPPKASVFMYADL